MDQQIPVIPNDVQDINSYAWKKLCDYVELVAEEERDEFSPFEYLGKDLYGQIHTLPESISKLKKVTKVWLYGSKLMRIPPEIGEMESLEYFDPYTSNQLHWLPFEITKCKKLKDSRVSTRVLYGNFKNRMPFPDLRENPVRYSGEMVNCSVCGKSMGYHETNQLWVTLYVGTDFLPLLANLCSSACKDKLPKPPDHQTDSHRRNYVQFPHKGGAGLIQPESDIDFYRKLEEKFRRGESLADMNKSPENDTPELPKKRYKTLGLIRKIWKGREEN